MPLSARGRITRLRNYQPHGNTVGLDHDLAQQEPNDLCSHYRTPIEGLYLCGSSAYPGGMVLLASGYVAASVIADDLKIEKWWKAPDYDVLFLFS